jgi:hypothetical protein
MMVEIKKTLDFVNEETGASFRAIIIGMGEIHRGSKRHTRNGAIIQFYDRGSSTEADPNGSPLEFHRASFFLSTDFFKRPAWANSSLKISAKNCEQITEWVMRIALTLRGMNGFGIENPKQYFD